MTAIVATRPQPLLSVFCRPQNYTAIIALAVFFLVPFLWNQPFVTHLFVTICVFASLATAWNIIGGYAGQLSLGHTVYYGIGAYTTALLIQHFSLTPWIGMWAGAALSAGFGLAIGYPCFRLRGPFFTLASIAFLEVIRLLAIHFSGLTGGSAGLIVPLRIGFEWMIFRDKIWYFVIAFMLLLVTLAISLALDRSRLGYYLTAVREREDAAKTAGIAATRVKLQAVALSAGLTSLIGSFHAMYLTFLEPATMFSLGTAIQIAMFALIGGLGTVSGPLAGTLIVVPLAELARAWFGASANGLHGFLYGSALVIITLTLPNGLVGTFSAKIERWLDRLPGGARPQRIGPVSAQTPRTTALSPQQMDQPVLIATNLMKSYGGLIATNDASLTLHQGEILGIIGPNGAGKTTLFNLLSGFAKPTKGTVTVFDENGVALTPSAPDAFARCGVGRTFQIVQPFGKHSVLDNIKIGAFMRHPRHADAEAAALRAAHLVGLDKVLDVEARNLPIGGLKRLEVARTLATEPRILLLDEVMAGQSQADTLKMVEMIQNIRANGVSIIAIEHNMHAIMSLSDRVIVIDTGRIIAEGKPEDIVQNRKVIEAYLGEDYVHAQGL